MIISATRTTHMVGYQLVDPLGIIEHWKTALTNQMMRLTASSAPNSANISPSCHPCCAVWPVIFPIWHIPGVRSVWVGISIWNFQKSKTHCLRYKFAREKSRFWEQSLLIRYSHELSKEKYCNTIMAYIDGLFYFRPLDFIPLRFHFFWKNSV